MGFDEVTGPPKELGLESLRAKARDMIKKGNGHDLGEEEGAKTFSPLPPAPSEATDGPITLSAIGPDLRFSKPRVRARVRRYHDRSKGIEQTDYKRGLPSMRVTRRSNP